MKIMGTKVGLVMAALLLAVAAGACGKSTSSGAPAAAAASTWKAGDKVDVEWNGSWWQGSILAVDGTKYRVHYTGWASSWDESVEASRLRAPTGTAQKGSEAN